MVEQQLKPILAYMKAHIVPTYVFIEEKDFYEKKLSMMMSFSFRTVSGGYRDGYRGFCRNSSQKDAEYDF